MPRPRLQRAATARREKVQLRIREQSFFPIIIITPPWVGSRYPMGWWLGFAPVTLEFWVQFPNERNQDQGKQAHPVLKYRVPQ
jgi:hypothetical protein